MIKQGYDTYHGFYGRIIEFKRFEQSFEFFDIIIMRKEKAELCFKAVTACPYNT